MPWGKRRRKSLRERLYEKCVREEECLRWVGATSNGRAYMNLDGKATIAARLIAHVEWGFDLNSEKHILHKPECKLREKCMDYKHLYEGDHFDNMSDKSRDITHCPYGHEYTKENTILDNGYRKCKACVYARNRTYSYNKYHGILET